MAKVDDIVQQDAAFERGPPLVLDEIRDRVCEIVTDARDRRIEILEALWGEQAEKPFILHVRGHGMWAFKTTAEAMNAAAAWRQKLGRPV